MPFKVAITFAILLVCLVSPSTSDRTTPRRALASSGPLTPDFYDKSCPNVFSIVNQVVAEAIAKEKRMGASLLRLHFHDCFVNGCDGSILLDDTPTLMGEKTARPNNNSVRGFDVIDTIKSAVEKSCPNVVSCADILAITARSSVVQLGGKTWGVKLGRRDSLTANFNAANNGAIPAPTLNLTALINVFSQHGLSSNDLVVLTGAHTIGQARCTSFRPRIYNETNIDAEFAKTARSGCPSLSGNGDNNLEPLDVQTPTCMDEKYFVNLVSNKGLLHSDQQLYNGGSTSSLVKRYSQNPATFLADFGAAMIKMGDISPLTGSQGQVRKNCRKPN